MEYQRSRGKRIRHIKDKYQDTRIQGRSKDEVETF